MTPDDVPVLLRIFGDAEVMRFYPVPSDEARMYCWAASRRDVGLSLEVSKPGSQQFIHQLRHFDRCRAEALVGELAADAGGF